VIHRGAAKPIDRTPVQAEIPTQVAEPDQDATINQSPLFAPDGDNVVDISKYKKAAESAIVEKKRPQPTNPDLWSRAKSAARSKFDVYPSAYANAWAAKWYKSKGGGWRMGKPKKK
jgi:hypothetical protein